MARHDWSPEDIDFPLFLELFNQERGFRTSPPQFRMAEWLEETDRDQYRILQVYRESGKTDVTNIWCCWKLFRDPNYTIVLVSSTNSVAEKKSRFIRQAISGFYMTNHLKPADPELWKTDRFTVDRTAIIADPSVYVTSVEADFTGQRGKMLLADDWETANNTKTDKNRENLWSRYQDFVPVCNAQLWVGTPHHTDTIYRKLRDQPLEYKELNIPVMDEFGTPANGEVEINGFVQDNEWIENKRASMSEGKFQSQYMLKAVRSYESQFKLDLIRVEPFKVNVVENSALLARDDLMTFKPFSYFIGDDELKDIVAYWDPASGRHGRDDSVLAVAMAGESGNVYIAAAVELSPVNLNQTFEVQCDEVIATCQRYGVQTVHVEKNFSLTLATELRRVAKRRKVRIVVKESHRTSNQNKLDFIADHFDPLIPNYS